MKTKLWMALLLLALAGPAMGQTKMRVAGPDRVHFSVWPTNLLVVTQACRVYSIQVQNHHTADLYLHVFDWRTNAVQASTNKVPQVPTLKVFAGLSGGLDWPQGRPFTNGVWVAPSTGEYLHTNAGALFSIDINYTTPP